MKTKIEWYQEVLDLEPGSKVFFPLAKLFVENERYSEAQDTLRLGLERYPEHIEAKLLLVDVLLKLGRTEEMNREVRSFTAKIGGYPGFWQAMADVFSRDEKSRDFALALNFLAAHFKGADISWVDVIEQGLDAVLRACGAGGGASRDQKEISLRPVERKEEEEPEPETSAPAEPEKEAEDKAVVARKAAASLEPAAGDERAAEEEPFTLRTRTMADLLAEQGDYAGALDIFLELRERAGTESKKEDLDQRIESMRQLAKSGGHPGPRPSREKKSAKQGDEAAPGRGKKKLIRVLEDLAARLEHRAEG